MLTGVRLSTEFVNVIMEKVDMIVSFLYKIKSIERHASGAGIHSTFRLLAGVPPNISDPFMNYYNIFRSRRLQRCLYVCIAYN